MTDRQAAIERKHPGDHIPDWESGAWGVIVGASKCKACGRVSSAADFRRKGAR